MVSEHSADRVVVSTEDNGSFFDMESSEYDMPVVPKQNLVFPIKYKVIGLGLSLVTLLGLVFLNMPGPCSKRFVSEADLEQRKVVLVLKGEQQQAIGKLNVSMARDSMARAMKAAGTEAEHKWEQAHPLRKLPNAIQEHKAANTAKELKDAGTAQCIFNVAEAWASVYGMGVSLAGIIKTCPPPRDGVSEFACQVDSTFLIAWVGVIAAKLSLAASNCAQNLNVDAICAAGVTGLVSLFGELSAGAILAKETCGPPPKLPTDKISMLGDKGRRLQIGGGAVSNGLQCGVDVSIVASNFANFGLAINNAVKGPNCKHDALNSGVNRHTGVISALCAVDIGGAITYFLQSFVFLNLAVLHCQDTINAQILCTIGISGMLTAAAGTVPYGSAIHAACNYNGLLKSPEKQKLYNEIYAKKTRRLQGTLTDVESVLLQMGFNETSTAPDLDSKPSPADIDKLVDLMSSAVGERQCIE